LVQRRKFLRFQEREDPNKCSFCKGPFSGTYIEWSILGTFSDMGEKYMGTYCSFNCLEKAKAKRSKKEVKK